MTQDEKAARDGQGPLERRPARRRHRGRRRPPGWSLIASGKGGVGKSSVTVNLAAALAARGLTVGVLDADIWGFSVPRMLGVSRAASAAPRADERQEDRSRTSARSATGVLEVVSMGFLVEDEETALMWRGLMLNRGVQHFLEDVDWGDDLDYLLIDMPPGTGDVQMGVAKLLPARRDASS